MVSANLFLGGMAPLLTGCSLFGGGKTNTNTSSVTTQSVSSPASSVDDTISISTIDDWAQLKGGKGHYRLEADLDLSSGVSPIDSFEGRLDGNGHILRNFTQEVNQDNFGLFRTNKGVIKNITLENFTFSGYASVSNVGFLVGNNDYGSLYNISVSGNLTVSEATSVGGVCGYSSGGILQKCTSEAIVTGKENVGGIAGKSIIRAEDNVYGENTNSGAVNGTKSIGGIYGWIEAYCGKYGSITATVQKDKNIGTIEGTDWGTGGIAGCTKGFYDSGFKSVLSLINETSEATIQGVNGVGGIAGNESGDSQIISYSKVKGTITGKSSVGGIAGYFMGGDLSKNETDPTLIVTAGYTVGGIAGEAYSVNSCINNAKVVVTSSLIENSLSKVNCGGIVGKSPRVHHCTNNGMIAIQSPDDDPCYIGGIVGYLNAGNIQPTLDDNVNTVDLEGKGSYLGGILGAATTASALTITGNHNQGKITSTSSQVGGIIGGLVTERSFNQNGNITIAGNINDKDISAKNDVGGILGYSASEAITLSSGNVNNGNITGSGSAVGGILGNGKAVTIKSLTMESTVNVKGAYYVGGIAGIGGFISNCKNHAHVETSSIDVDATTLTPYAYLGGIAGMARNVTNCTNDADVIAVQGGGDVGGIAGKIACDANELNAEENTNSGKVEGADNVGGIFGELLFFTKGSLLTSTNTGAIKGNIHVGGIAGYVGINGRPFNDNPNCLYLKQNTNEGSVSGSEYIGGITGYVKAGQTSYTQDLPIAIVYNTNKGAIVGSGTKNIALICGYAEKNVNNSSDTDWQTNQNVGGTCANQNGTVDALAYYAV